MTRSVMISGAGPAGMALAKFLSADGWTVTVVERAAGIRTDGYAVDLRGEGVRVAESLGLLGDLRAQQTTMTGTAVLDLAGEQVSELPAAEFAGDVEVPKAVLTRLLHETTRADVAYVFGDSVVEVDQRDGRVHVSLESGRTEAVDLLVGADGVWSRTRRLAVTDDPAVVRHLGLSGVGFTTDNFLGLNNQGVLRAGPRHAVYAFSAQEPSRLTVSLTFASRSAALDRAGRAEQEAAVLDAFADGGWHVPALLDRMRAADDFYFASACQVHLSRWSEGRVVLIGDAACCAAPTSGMGTTQAFVAARTLADALRDHDVATALRVYEERMRPQVEQNQALGVQGAARFGADAG